MRLRFGFGGDQPASYATIAEHLRLSLRTVHRCERRALEALRRDRAVAAAHAA